MCGGGSQIQRRWSGCARRLSAACASSISEQFMGECLLHCCLALLQSKDTSPHPVVIEGGIKPGEWHG